MNVFTEFFLFFMSILQFLFPFAFKDDVVVPEETTDIVIEDVIPEDHEHTGGNNNCLQSAVCEICGEIYGSRGDHVYSATVTPATCLEGGYTTYRCRFCLVTIVDEYTDATGHSFEISTTKATCVVPAYEYHSCINCGYSYGDEIEPAKGHKYKEEYSSADCTKGYTIVHRCETCKYSYREEASAALGHDYKETEVAATCTTQGYTLSKCIRCDKSEKSNYTPMTEHQFTEYVFNNDATCSTGGTKTAYCDFDCGMSETVAADGERLPHTDYDKDTKCDDCGTDVYVDYTYLQYPAAALADHVPLATFLEKAGANYGTDEYSANKGTDYNGIRTSDYFTAKVTGRVNGADAVSATTIPVYGTLTFVGATQGGALHSFSEIYIKEGEYDTFTIEIEGKGLGITSAVILPASSGETVTVKNNKATAVLSGLGTHTFLFNGKDEQRYAYTVHVRAEIDEDVEIAQLREAGYTVEVVDSMTYTSDLPYVDYVGRQNLVIYLRKGAYFAVKHQYDINNSTDESGNSDPGVNTGIGGQNRWAFVTVNGCKNYKLMGYGAIDLSRLDRAERRGMIFSWSENIELRGIKLINAPQWSIMTYRVNNMTIKDVDVYGYRQNSDAFDICNSTNVTIDGGFARTGDDGFVVKTLGGDDNAVSDTITVKNSYAWVGKARAFGIFGETHKDISNVTFKDNTVLFHDATWDYLRIPAIGIVIEGDETNPSLAAQNSDTTISNVTFENIEICRNRSSAMNAIIYNDVKNSLIDGLVFRNISFEKINTVKYGDENVRSVSTINTFSPDSSISRNVVVENIICGNTKVTDDNCLDYFEENILHYCESIK